MKIRKIFSIFISIILILLIIILSIKVFNKSKQTTIIGNTIDNLSSQVNELEQGAQDLEGSV